MLHRCLLVVGAEGGTKLRVPSGEIYQKKNIELCFVDTLVGIEGLGRPFEISSDYGSLKFAYANLTDDQYERAIKLFS